MIHLGIKECLYNVRRTLLSVFLLSLTFIICIVYFTAYDSQYARYRPFKEMLEGEGALTFLGIEYHNAENFASELQKVKVFDYMFSAQVVSEDLDTEHMTKIYGLSENEASYRPAMAEGRWISELTGESENPRAVICANRYGIKAGDTIKAVYVDTEYTIDICGVLENDASCFTAPSLGRDNTLFDMYYTFDADREDMGMSLFMPVEDMKRFGLGWYSSFFIVSYEDDISEEELESNRKLLESASAGIILENKDVRERTLALIDKKMTTITPIAFAGALLLFFGFGSLVGMDVKSKLGQYAVYYTCGMRWKQCLALNFVQSVFSALPAVILTVLTGNVIKLSGLKNKIGFEYGRLQFGACLVVFIAFMLLSVLIPYVITRRDQPRDVLRKAKL